MANCDSCPSKGKCGSDNKSCMVENNPNNKVKHVIAVMSGKGGVGKSTVTSLLACEMERRGYRVGVLDADITGPSIPRLFGAKNHNVNIDELGIHPYKTQGGISLMSMNLLTEYEEQAVIWRGPMIASAVRQFWTDVYWGELDFLFVDMPPGTGDVPLTVLQVMPVSGVVMVSTPQSMVSMIVAKAVNMTRDMNVNVLGVIENMSHIKCKNCEEKTYIFGKDTPEAAAQKVGANLLGDLPLDPEMVEYAETGRIEEYSRIQDHFEKPVDEILKNLNIEA